MTIADKKAHFHFYGSLNDFQKSVPKKDDRIYYFHGRPAVKDAIEAIGVPHTEVNLIEVNGRAVNFVYQLQEDDDISVYPVTEIPEKIPHPQFILDVHLGTLARYLRLLGIDSGYNNQYNDVEIIRLSRQQQRIILTRDVGLLKHKSVLQGYWLRQTDPKAQVHELLGRFALSPYLKPFGRCMVCNGLLHPVEKMSVIEQLPPKTRLFYEIFHQCAHCQKIYWQGAHFRKMLALVSELTGT